PRRGAKHHIDADEDVFDAIGRKQPHDRHRRSFPGRPAERTDLRACGSHKTARRRRRHRAGEIHGRGRDPPRTGGADRRGLRGIAAEAGNQEAVMRKSLPESSLLERGTPAFRKSSATMALPAPPETEVLIVAEGVVHRAIETAAAMVEADTGDAELAVMLTDDAGIRTLDRNWRGQDKPTNVLSFPALQPPAGREPDDAP